jgi:predicted nucleic acid-binding protein
LERVYLDTCAWCRPFDKLDHKEIVEEFNAVVKIIQRAMEGEIELISSSAVFVEVSLIEPTRREKVETLINRIAAQELKPSMGTRELAKKIVEDCGLDNMDSAHLALALENGIDVFLSTDKDLYLYKKNCISEYGILVKNPTEYEAER